jgi:hypothetical protein
MASAHRRKRPFDQAAAEKTIYAVGREIGEVLKAHRADIDALRGEIAALKRQAAIRALPGKADQAA